MKHQECAAGFSYDVTCLRKLVSTETCGRLA
jgi:hypothetical protein